MLVFKQKNLVMIIFLIFTVSNVLNVDNFNVTIKNGLLVSQATQFQSEENINLTITQACYQCESFQIQIKYDLCFKEDTTIRTRTTALFYYSFIASSNENWLFPKVAGDAITTHTFEKSIYSYKLNFDLDIEESSFEPKYFDIEVGIEDHNISDLCRIIKEDNYSVIYDIENYQFTNGFAGWILFSSFTSLVIIQIKLKRK